MKFLLEKITRKFCSLPTKYKEWKKRERKYSKGIEYSDKTFYIISYDYDTQGLFAIVKSVLSHVMYAVDKGWTPVVDLKNYDCQYKQEGKNAWELFFQQPFGYTLNDIKSAKHIVRSYYGMYPYGKYAFYEEILFDENKLKPIAEAYKKYIKPQPKVEELIKQTIKELKVND